MDQQRRWVCGVGVVHGQRLLWGKPEDGWVWRGRGGSGRVAWWERARVCLFNHAATGEMPLSSLKCVLVRMGLRTCVSEAQKDTFVRVSRKSAREKAYIYSAWSKNALHAVVHAWTTACSRTNRILKYVDTFNTCLYMVVSLYIPMSIFAVRSLRGLVFFLSLNAGIANGWNWSGSIAARTAAS